MTVFDKFKVPDGRAIGDVRYSELGSLVGASMRWMSIYQQLRAHGSPVDADTKIRDFVNSKKLEQIIEESKKIDDGIPHEGVLMSPEGRWSLIRSAVA